MALKSNIQNFQPARQVYKEEIVLLSRGYVAPNSFPEGKITVYPWDAEIDEWLQTRARKPKRHLMMWELLAKLCNLNGCPVEDFLIGDVNTVLLVARAILHHSVVRYQPLCPHCGIMGISEELKIPNELTRVGEKPLDYPGWDRVVLPHSRDVVKIRPLRIKDAIILEERSKEDKARISEKVAEILSSVVSVGNGTEEGVADSVDELVIWWSALHPSDKQKLETSRTELLPHLSPNIKHLCDNEQCGREFDHVLPLDEQFFR